MRPCEQFLKLNDWTRASQMDSAEDHKQFLRGQYVPQCKLDCLSPGDIVLLRRYGYWLEALAAGDINPITDAQTAFVRVHRRACAPQTVFEILWFNYQIERIYELAQRTERTLGASEGFQYWQVHEIYRKAAILGHSGAKAWIEGQGDAGPTPSEIDALDLSLPNVRPVEPNPGSRAVRTPGNPTSVETSDWSDLFDDFGSDFWEHHLGGPNY